MVTNSASVLLQAAPRKIALGLCALLCIALFGNAAAAEVGSAAYATRTVDGDLRFSELRKDLAGKVDRGELVSVAIGVIHKGKIVWAEAFGWADREAKVRATIDTRYGIASVGKSITATAVMSLVAYGALSLDTRVSSLLPAEAVDSVPGTASPSLRQLLNMSAGIAHGAYTYENGAAPAPGLGEHRRAIAAFAPGSVFHYSNFSIDLAEQIIEKTTKMTFAQVLQSRVFGPLGMINTALEPAPQLPTPAIRYDDHGQRIAPILTRPRSSRGMHTSLNDLLRYTAFHLQTPLPGQRSVLPARWIERMQRERSGLPGAHMALGIASLDIDNNRQWLISSGQDMGVQASLSMLPKEQVGVVVLTNSSGGVADELGIRAVDAVVPGFTATAMASIESFEAHTRPWTATPEWTGAWQGTIQTANGPLALRVDFQPDGEIRLTIDDQYPTVLSEANLREGLLTGAFLGKLPLEEASKTWHRIELGLVREGSRIRGFALANFRNEHGKFELPTQVLLSRMPGASDSN